MPRLRPQLRMIFLYRLLFLPLLIPALPHYLARMRKRGGYGRMMGGVFGLGKKLEPPLPGIRRIWVHAVSVGEVNAATPLIQDLAACPDTEIVLTVTTSTGFSLAEQKLKNVCADIRPFPLDFWPFSVAAWRRIRPNMCLMMEGELWPEHLQQAHKRGVPVLLVNARLSDRSWKRYNKVLPFARGLVFSKLSLVLTGNLQDTGRFEKLGLHNVRYGGQLKCDKPVEPRLDAEQRAELRRELFPDIGPESLVMLGSSTWPGEENFLLHVLKTMRKDKDIRLLLVPRHAERRAEVSAELEAFGLPWHRRSDGGTVERGMLIHLADTTGELGILTQAADFAFIGKSLPPHREGQSPIEAAALGVPLVMGPGMSNFRDIARSLTEAGAALQATDSDTAADSLLTLACDAGQRRSMSDKAQEWFLSQRGARKKALEAVDHLYGLPVADL